MTVVVLRILHIATLACAALASGIVITSNRHRYSDLMVRAVLIGAASGVLGLALRTAVSGHLPIFGTLENTWVTATALLGTAAVSWKRAKIGSAYVHLLLPWSLVFGLWGFKGRFEPVPLTISEQSLWVDLHVLLAWIGFVSLLWAATISFVQLFAARRRKMEPNADSPSSYDPQAQVLAVRLLMIGYVFLTAMLVAGSWYLFVLFGDFWRWEVVGVTALVTWLGYSIVVHGWLLHGWRGKYVYWGIAGLVVPLILLYWIWSVFPGTYHFFDIPLMSSY